MAETLAEKVAALKFEEAVSRLEQVVRELESGEKPLEECLALFNEGVLLARHCQQKLDEAEGRIEELLETQNGVATRPLEQKEIE